MKKYFILLSAILVLASCENKEEYQEISGDFIYLEDVAVIKGSDFIYGVKIDAKAKELAKRIENIKVDEFDMIPVVVKGIINKNENKEAGDVLWEEIVTIKEIVSVSNSPSQPDVKLE